MRPYKISVAIAIITGVGVLATLSFTQGQDRPPTSPPTSPQRPSGQPAAPRPPRDLTKWPLFPKLVYLSAQRGSEWLQRANGADGRFVTGYVPALRLPLDGDSCLRQAGAAFALAKAAKYFHDEQAAAIARQAVLTLLEDTVLEEPKGSGIRVSAIPAGMANHLGAAAVLVQAIHELPEPGSDVLDKADQLCNFIRRAQRTDGSLSCADPGPDGKSGPDDKEAVNLYPGEALYALMRSQQQRPAAWKLEVVRKAMPYYQAHWRANKTLVFVPRHTAAYAEAYKQTDQKPFADFVFEMNDWLCTLQFRQLDPQRPLWIGGFMSCVDGKSVTGPPNVFAAACADSLADAARVARQVGDLPRWERYKDALERCVQFLTSLQYTEANSLHFTDWYRPKILGAFHNSHTDGNIRLDCTAQAVCGTIGYLTYVAEAP